MAVTLVNDWTYALAQCAAERAVRRSAWPTGVYIRVHHVESPFPATLPSVYGESVFLYEPTAEDMAATDWRLT